MIGNALLALLKAAEKPYEVWDTRLTGFMVRVQPTGTKTYYLEYGRHKRIKLSRVGILTPAQARERAREIMAAAASGIDPMAARRQTKEPTLTTFLSEQYAPWYTSNHRRDIWPHLKSLDSEFGKTQLGKLTVWNIEKWRTNQIKAGVSATTINRRLGALKSALNRAVEWRALSVNPISVVRPLKIDSKATVRYLTPDEETMLRKALAKRDAAGSEARMRGNAWRVERGYPPLPDVKEAYIDHLTPAVLLSINTGVRRGELLGLERSDIDLSRAILTIRGSGAKSGQTRHIPLNQEALDVLRTWMTQTEGDRLFPANPRKGWEALLRKAGIDNFRWHDMRHHFASRLVMAGVDLNTVRELLGHASIAMTLRYAHLSDEGKAAAVAKLVK